MQRNVAELARYGVMSTSERVDELSTENQNIRSHLQALRSFSQFCSTLLANQAADYSAVADLEKKRANSILSMYSQNNHLHYVGLVTEEHVLNYQNALAWAAGIVANESRSIYDDAALAVFEAAKAELGRRSSPQERVVIEKGLVLAHQLHIASDQEKETAASALREYALQKAPGKSNKLGKLTGALLVFLGVGLLATCISLAVLCPPVGMLLIGGTMAGTWGCISLIVGGVVGASSMQSGYSRSLSLFAKQAVTSPGSSPVTNMRSTEGPAL